ncbi:hypothetical protein FBZ93_111204 [Bradyrhizobium macuxiense]|uniref:Uncharacterized protein n=1 Tax=Bradyrhizobium macuxiense TaxID=1755647 RepID=A0A560LCT2_9BRAD|nr:hypothetical protein FBZ93_111204 [Bradyrhizobium macuxiense]
MRQTRGWMQLQGMRVTKPRSLPASGPISLTYRQFLVKEETLEWKPSSSFVLPIYLSVTYELDGDPNHIADVYSGEADDFTCIRIINPTTSALERRCLTLRGLDPV